MNFHKTVPQGHRKGPHTFLVVNQTKACFPLVVTNATERLQELIDDKVEEMKDEVLTALINNTDYFIDQSYDYFGTE